MNPILWQASDKFKQQCQMSDFIQFVQTHYAPQIENYTLLYEWSILDKAQFWQAVWRYSQIKSNDAIEDVLQSTEDFPFFQWFPQTRFNFAENLLRHATSSNPALVFWNEEGFQQSLSYQELYAATAKLAHSLRELGVQSGDRVAAVLPNIPETIIAMLATTSIGAIWSSCSPDFGRDGIVDRFEQIQPKVLFCCSSYRYKGKKISLLEKISQVCATIGSIKNRILIPYFEEITDKNYFSWQNCLDNSSTFLEFAQLPFNHPLYIMYSSGTTGKPKCIVHSAGGTLIQHIKELQLHTDVKASDCIFYYTTCGWMMWNWLVSSLATGAKLVLYDGAPTYPNADSLFAMAEKEQISVFGCSAKYLSAIEKMQAVPRQKYALDALRCILSTGSPLLPESFDYVYENISPSVQLSSISGGTDIISCFALGNPLLPVRRGELQGAGLGMQVEIFDEQGNSVVGQKGELVCYPPFPSMPIGFWQDEQHKKYRASYFERFENIWAHGDYGCLTEHGGLIIYGRSDAVLNPGGVRIGTAEIYAQVEKLPEIIESIAVSQDWQGDSRIVLFVVLRDGAELDLALQERIRKQIRDNTSPHHVPAKIIQVEDIPRTISGKIVELAVHKIIHNQTVENTTALANPQSLQLFKNLPELNS